jgi:hypothetical protein
MIAYRKPAVFLLLLPPVLALALLAAGGVFPLRLDCRTLQHLTKFDGLDASLAGAREIVFLSRDNGEAAGHMAEFTLRHLAFPDARRTWIILAENRAGDWWGDWVAVDAKGEFFEPGRPPPAVVPAGRPPALGLAGTAFVCDSREVFAEFQKRIPSLASAGAPVFLDGLHGRSGFVFSAPRSEFSFARILRISLLLGAVLAWTMLAAVRADSRWAGAAAGVVGGFAAQIWLASLSWSALPILLAGQWAAGIFLLRAAPPVPRPRVTNSGICAAAVLAVSLAVFLIRLDFDGDVLTHWLPMARSYFHLGRHDPATLLAQGSMHAATYPPGYGVFLAIAMWAADLDPARPFLTGPATSLAILCYRLAVWLLNVAFLGALAGLIIRRSSSRSFLWLAALALVAGIFPTLRGTHVAAETLLFPVLGTALVLLAGARGRTVLGGIALAGVAVLIKWEAALLVAAVFGPWFLAVIAREPALASPKFLALAAVTGLVAILPAALWKSGMHIDNGFFNPPSIGALWTGRAEWVSLLMASLTLVLKTPLWIPLFLLLPAGWILGTRRGFRWSELLVPAATAVLFFALVSMYLFSNWSTKTLHIEQSLDRLLYIPALSCILYFLLNLADSAKPPDD